MNDSTIYFFERCRELIHNKTFDSFRVHLHNPYTIFNELKITIERFNKKRIKHFDPTIKAVIEEAKGIINDDHIEDVFTFSTWTSKQLINSLKECESGKKNRTITMICKTLCHHNLNFKNSLFDKIKNILLEDNEDRIIKLDTYTGWLITQLIHLEYSRKYIKSEFKKARTAIESGIDITSAIESLKEIFNKTKEEYNVIFKINSNAIQDFKLASNSLQILASFYEEFTNKEYKKEKCTQNSTDEGYLSVSISALDFQSALFDAYKIVSETIDINILHDIDNSVVVEKHALVIHSESRMYRFWPIEQSIDGFYQYNEDEFSRFTSNLRSLDENSVAKIGRAHV